MKRNNLYTDDICGKENSDYIGEFSPHRLFIAYLEEDSDKIFDANEEKTLISSQSDYS